MTTEINIPFETVEYNAHNIGSDWMRQLKIGDLLGLQTRVLRDSSEWKMNWIQVKVTKVEYHMLILSDDVENEPFKYNISIPRKKDDIVICSIETYNHINRLDLDK